MLRTAVLMLASLLATFTPALALDGDLAPVPLCRALESIQPGDQIPIVVSGIYAVDYLYDPEATVCRLDVNPQTCVEFSAGVVLPAEFESVHNGLESGRVSVTFFGVLHGPPDVPVPAFVPSVSTAHRALARNSTDKLYCGNRYRTKLVVNSILSLSRVSEETPWPGQREAPRDEPVPIEMAMPKYPPIARNIDYEGVALVNVTVVAGEVARAEVQFGDAVLVDEVLTNVRSWRFAPDVNTTFTVEYDFRLENRPRAHGQNPVIEMRLPSYVRVTGLRRNF